MLLWTEVGKLRRKQNWDKESKTTAFFVIVIKYEVVADEVRSVFQGGRPSGLRIQGEARSREQDLEVAIMRGKIQRSGNSEALLEQQHTSREKPFWEGSTFGREKMKKESRGNRRNNQTNRKVRIALCL